MSWCELWKVHIYYELGWIVQNNSHYLYVCGVTKKVCEVTYFLNDHATRTFICRETTDTNLPLNKARRKYIKLVLKINLFCLVD